MSTPPFLRPLAPIEPRDVVLGVTPAVAGFVVGIATNTSGQAWYRRLSKPPWTPPAAAFGPVWTTLYVLMGIAAVIVARAGRTPPSAGPEGMDDPGHPSTDARGPVNETPVPVNEAARSSRRADGALLLFGGQLGLNLLWSVLFFGLRRIRLAGVELVVLWVSIAATAVAFARVRIVAGLLLLPYLAWTTLAAALNADIIRRNPRA